ncbi:MAG: hypothetical protein R3F43_01455 [bacterium]
MLIRLDALTQQSVAEAAATMPTRPTIRPRRAACSRASGGW